MPKRSPPRPPDTLESTLEQARAEFERTEQRIRLIEVNALRRFIQHRTPTQAELEQELAELMKLDVYEVRALLAAVDSPP